MKFFCFRIFVEKVSKDESFVGESHSVENEGQNQQNNNNQSSGSKNGKRVRYETNPLNFIYPQFIVIFLIFLKKTLFFPLFFYSQND